MITIQNGLDDKMLLMRADDLSFTTDQETAVVTISHAGTELYKQTLYTNPDGSIRLSDLAEIYKPTLRKKLVDTFTVSIDDNATVYSKDILLLYCLGAGPANFEVLTETYFLSPMLGVKTIAANHKEWLHLYITEETSVNATISSLVDGAVVSTPFHIADLSPDGNIATVDVSPERLEYQGELLSYEITAGARSQWYTINNKMDADIAAPALLWTNSFGCQETLYCYGTHKIAPKLERSSATVRNMTRNYNMQETRNFKANTGPMTAEQAIWIDDFFRSTEVYILVNGLPGPEILLTESDNERSNAYNAIFSANFEYTYSTRKQNIFSTAIAGRVFDNTFDKTFA